MLRVHDVVTHYPSEYDKRTQNALLVRSNVLFPNKKGSPSSSGVLLNREHFWVILG
uniref:Uncharacterized protein n=1 Tax=Anguilla anguilla TaxID=7936 RepID=A0A0E9Q371_ANGAN